MAQASGSFAEQLFIPTHPEPIDHSGTIECPPRDILSDQPALRREQDRSVAVVRDDVFDLIGSPEEFFFGPPGKKEGRAYRHGAVRLLNDRINLLREGKFEDRIRRDTKVYPALLTFDNIGESPALYMWLRERCAAEGLLQQAGVAPLALVRVDRFEEVLALAAAGTPSIKLFERKAQPECVDRNFDRIVHEFGEKKALRLPQLEAEFERISADVTELLFGAR